MTESVTSPPLTPARRTNQEFAQQLVVWSFAQRKIDGPHRVYRGPHGGTLRVLRSLLGRADPGQAEKAAHLAGVTVERFWAGPDGDLLESQPAPTPTPATQHQRSAAQDRVT